MVSKSEIIGTLAETKQAADEILENVVSLEWRVKEIEDTLNDEVFISDILIIVEQNEKLLERMAQIENQIKEHALGVQNVFAKYESVHKAVVALSVSFKGLRSFISNCPDEIK